MLWIRLGDADDYHSEDDIESVAAHLACFMVRRVRPCNLYGVTARDFEGNNYISLFWGDAGAQPTRGLTSEELGQLNSQLRKVSA